MSQNLKPWFKKLIKFLAYNSLTLVLFILFFIYQSVTAHHAAQTTIASSSPLLSYQGTLTNINGNLITDSVEIEFALYNQAEGGTPIWTEAYAEDQSVQVTEGQFHVLLGSQTPLNPDDLTGDVFLGITIGGEEMLPRERLVGVPYTMSMLAGATTQGDLTIGDRLYVENGIDMQNDSRIWHLGSGNVDFSIGGTSDTGNAYMTLHEGTQFAFNTKNSQGEGRNVFVVGRNEIESRLPLDMSGNNIKLGGGAKLWTNSTDNIRFYLPDGSKVEFANKFIPWRTIDMKGNSITNCGALTEANLQTPEELEAERIDRFEEGDVLCWGEGQLEKCAQDNDILVQAVADGDGRPIVIGAEVIKVLGPVERGDILVASGVPGYATVNNDAPDGAVIAQALENYDGQFGLIKAMIRKW